jgi:molybdate transport system substrate-binding protein
MARLPFAAIAVATASLLLPANVAGSAEVKILAGSAIESAMLELMPTFEQSSRHQLNSDFNGAIGAMTDRVLKGEPADVVIVSESQVEILEKAGKVLPSSRTDIARVGVGIFVRKGAPKPHIDSVEAFKQTMLAAKSIGWNDPAAGAPVSIYMLGVLERLGIADQMKHKTVAFKQRSERFGAIARGDIEIGFNQISEILAAPGVDLVGPLPEPIQNYTLFAGAIVATSNVPQPSQSLLKFLSSSESQAIWKAKGFETP